MQKDPVHVMPEITLCTPTQEDTSSFVKYLKEKEISDHTLLIPYPYTEEDGRKFIESVEVRIREFGRLMDWAIREKDGELLGMISFRGKYKNDSSKDEIGFWLAKPFWGRAIMTQVLKRFVSFGFKEYRYRRFEMEIFSFNRASMRVAEKCGFHREKFIERAHCKDGKWVDAYLYVLEVKGDLV